MIFNFSSLKGSRLPSKSKSPSKTQKAQSSKSQSSNLFNPLPLKLELFLSIALYALPVVFFIISYFVIITSGEDIFQGASTPVNILGDSLAAFKHSVRLADMYAWSVINFFDYSYSFGIDTLFRLLDVFIAFSIFYLSTYIVLRRRPRLRLPDACIFATIFLAVFLTSNGLTLYAGFSKIHNYLFICFFTLIFGIFYLRDLWSRSGSNAPASETSSSSSPSFVSKFATSRFFAPFMFILGFIFGFASNVTAIVFLLTLPCYKLYKILSTSNPVAKSSTPTQQLPKSSLKTASSCSSWSKNLLSWRLAGVLGILLAVALMYFVGDGLGDYNSNPAYVTVLDYLPFKDIFASPVSSSIRILKHNLYNFARFLFPFFVASIFALIFLFFAYKKASKFQNPSNPSLQKSQKPQTHPLSSPRKSLNLPLSSFSKSLVLSFSALAREKDFLVASLIFIFLHILAMSQIYYPTRLVLPAYLFAISIYLFVFKLLFKSLINPLDSSQNLNRRTSTSPVSIILPLSLFLILLTLVLTALRAYFAFSYVAKIRPVLEEIKSSPSAEICVSPETALSPSLPYIHLGQEDFLVDWAIPQTIYNKSITYCE